MIGLLTLYQDWLPFLVAIGFVAVHHGVIGVVAPGSVYDHGAAVAHPWRWALIHAAFVLAASITHMASWRTNEQQLLADPLTGLPSRLRLMSRLERAHRAGSSAPSAVASPCSSSTSTASRSSTTASAITPATACCWP